MQKEKTPQKPSFQPAPSTRRPWGSWFRPSEREEDPEPLLLIHLADMTVAREGRVVKAPLSERSIILALRRLLPDQRRRFGPVLEELARESRYAGVRALCSDLLATDDNQ
jgi:hypothetical protein